MAEAKGAGSSDTLKVVGGAVFLLASVVLMLHRMPHRQYQAAHEDKARPPRPVAANPDAPTVAAKQVVVAPKAASVKPAAAAAVAKSQDAGTLPPTAAPSTPKVELADACVNEIGLFCNHVPAHNVRRCLSGYDPDAYLKTCREALGVRVADVPMTSEDLR